MICVDLKMLTFSLVSKVVTQNIPASCAFGTAELSNNNGVKKNWPERGTLLVRGRNVINVPLVERSKIIFPPLHTKLGLMKQCVEAPEPGCVQIHLYKDEESKHGKSNSWDFRWPSDQTDNERHKLCWLYE